MYISKRTMNEFREFLVGFTFREIGMEFENEHVAHDMSVKPAVDGQRRTFVEQHYATLDMDKVVHARKLLCVIGSALNKESQRVSQDVFRSKSRMLLSALACDGFEYHVESGEMLPTTTRNKNTFGDIHNENDISSAIRRNIFDAFRIENIYWGGELNEINFLEALYDLSSLPSFDGRYSDAGQDIWQHCINNNDWDIGWVYDDKRLNLLESRDEEFLSFICRMVHPVVRSDQVEVSNIVEIVNEQLNKVGWELAKGDVLARRPVYVAKKIGAQNPTVDVEVVHVLKSEYIGKQVHRMKSSIDSDPAAAIGASKEFLETIAKAILEIHGKECRTGYDFPGMMGMVRDVLNLLPEGVSEEKKGSKSIKKVLGALGTIISEMATLRNLYGTGHGMSPTTRGLSSRHARLTVGMASALGVFLYETHAEKGVPEH